MILYNLTHKAYQQYRYNTKGNRDTSKSLACMKLSRNITLGKVVAEDDTHITYRYGYLNVGVLKAAQLIVSCHQEFMTEPYEPDKVGYEFLNELYCISDDDNKGV